MAQSFGGLGRPLGHEQITVGASAVSIPNLPADTRRFLIRVVTNSIHWRDDGIDPDSTHGMPLLTDETLVYDSDPTNFRLIRAGASDADVRIAYYR